MRIRCPFLINEMTTETRLFFPIYNNNDELDSLDIREKKCIQAEMSRITGYSSHSTYQFPVCRSLFYILLSFFVMFLLVFFLLSVFTINNNHYLCCHSLVTSSSQVVQWQYDAINDFHLVEERRGERHTERELAVYICNVANKDLDILGWEQKQTLVWEHKIEDKKNTEREK